MQLLLSEVNAAVWEISRVRQLYRNTLTFLRLFRMTITTYRCCERDRSAVVKLSRLIAHDFSMRMEECIW